MSGFASADLAGTLATWVAALATIGVWSYLVGARRIFALLQYLLAGLATGYLALLAIREVLIPRLVAPLAADPGSHLLLIPAAGLATLLAGAAWLPVRATTPATAVLLGGLAAFALGGAVVGTVLPQMAAALPEGSGSPDQLGAVVALVITLLVLLGFLHGAPLGGLTSRAATTGRWLLVAGIGGWLGFLLASRLSLLVDRIGFLLGDWLAVLR
ncbi:MAG TPA: hypothetical protein VI733_00615 [Candidatus Limnocylindria bacterium]|nr:hypothetical protein [Candidatus Limnocylindria bacterium]